MFDRNALIFPPLLIAFISTALLTPFAIMLLKKVNLFDDPKKHKHPAILHKTPIPRGGGIPLFLGIFIASLIFLPLVKITIALLLSAVIALIIGVLDDKLDISPYLRFFANFATAGIVVGSGVTMSFITNPLGHGVLHLNTVTIPFYFLGTHGVLALSDILALVWIVWVMNMLNWSKGVDGQMPGIVAISAIVIGILSLRFPISEQNTLIAVRMSFIIAGASLGFLLYNFYPAKIFPGYGATCVYLLLSCVSILSGAKLATTILVMGVPMIDGLVTIIRRVASGRSPFWHDKKHLHHLLLNFGFSQRSIALFYWIISAILGAVSLTLTSQGKLFAIIMLFVILGGALLFLHAALEIRNEKTTL